MSAERDAVREALEGLMEMAEEVRRVLPRAQDAADHAHDHGLGSTLYRLRQRLSTAMNDVTKALAAHPAPPATGEPTPTDLIRELRQAAGLPDGARPDPPKVVWEETLAYVRSLRDAVYGQA